MTALVPEVLDIVRAPGEGTRSASGITFSKAPRAIQCLGSTVQPRVLEAEIGAPAEEGHAIHAFFGAAARLGRDAALDMVPEVYREICAAFELERLPTVNAERYSHEVAMAYDALNDRARIIGYDVGRNYGELADGEIPGSLDVLGVTDDGEGVVLGDYKSGRVPVPPPKKNWQLKIGAVAAARRFQARYAIVQIIHTRKGMKPWSETARLDAFDLDEAAEQLRDLVLRRKQLVKSYLQRGFAGLGDSLVRGDECRYCPSAPFCPAMASYVWAAVGDPLAFQRELVPLITPEQLGQAKASLGQLKGVVKQLEEQIKSCASVRPAVMPSGRFYGPVAQADDEIDGLIAFRVMKEWFGSLLKDDPKADEKADAAARVAVSVETSMEAIDRALKPIAARGARAAMVREALARIKFAGGIKPGTKTVYREYTGEPKALPKGKS
jgi:hypothetical protein